MVMPPMGPPQGMMPGATPGPLPPPPPGPGGGAPMQPMGGPDPSAMMPVPQPPPDPTAQIKDLIRTMDPMQLREFVKKMSKKDQTLLMALVADDDELSEFVNAAMPLPADYEPERPRWYKAPTKPVVTELLSTARRDYMAYQFLRDRFKDDWNAYMNRTWGRFGADQNKDIYSDDSTAFVGISLSSEINMRSALLAEHDISYQVPPLKPDLIDETQQEENFLYYLDDLAERRHANRAGGSFKYDVAWNLQVYGRAIVRRMLDLDDPEDPFDEVLIDPATCCPIWGGKHGLMRITIWRSDEINNVARDYDVNPKTITNPKTKNGNGDAFQPLSVENTVNVIEWYDEDWYGVYTEDGRPIKALTRHKYGEVPFIVQLVSRGLPAMFTDPAQKTTNPTDVIGGQRRSDLQHKGVSAIHWLKYTHRQREAFVSKIYDALLKSDNPPIWMGMDTFAKTRAASKLGTRKGKVYTYDKDHEQPAIPQYAPMPAIVGPLMEALGAEWSMAALPISQMGINPQANTSGAALDGLTEGGVSKLTVDALAMSQFYGRRAEQTLRFWRDWGRLVEDSDGRYGHFDVPARKRSPRGPAAFALTPEIIERTGTRVRVKLTNIRQAQLGAIGAAFVQLIQANLMTERDAIERLGNPDPDATMEERRYELMANDPRVAEQRIVAAALARTGEPIDPDELASLQAKMLIQKMMADMGGQGGGPQGAAPPPQGGPGGPPGGMPPVSAGIDRGDYGSPPGANGGAVGRPMLPSVSGA